MTAGLTYSLQTLTLLRLHFSGFCAQQDPELCSLMMLLDLGRPAVSPHQEARGLFAAAKTPTVGVLGN